MLLRWIVGLWVARTNDIPVGFAHAEMLEPTSAHLEELDLPPEQIRGGQAAGWLWQSVLGPGPSLSSTPRNSDGVPDEFHCRK